MRGKPWAALSPRLRACDLPAVSVSITRTGGPKRRATAAVSSVQPLQTTITSNSPGAAPLVIAFKVRAITEPSSCAGIITEIIRLLPPHGFALHSFARYGFAPQAL